jgi:hypothetical protein
MGDVGGHQIGNPVLLLQSRVHLDLSDVSADEHHTLVRIEQNFLLHELEIPGGAALLLAAAAHYLFILYNVFNRVFPEHLVIRARLEHLQV